MIQVVDKNDLMELIGYSETQASKLIRKAKSQLVQEDLNGIRINVLDVYRLLQLNPFLVFKYN